MSNPKSAFFTDAKNAVLKPTRTSRRTGGNSFPQNAESEMLLCFLLRGVTISLGEDLSLLASSLMQKGSGICSFVAYIWARIKHLVCINDYEKNCAFPTA